MAREKSSLLQSTRLVLIGTIVAKPLQLATNVLLARMLGPSGFGLLGLANSAAVTLSGMAGFGLGDAAAKFLAEYHRKDRERASELGSLILSTSFVVGLAFIGAAWFARPFWIHHLFPVATPESVVALCLTLALFNLLSSLLLNIFIGLQSFFDVAVLGILQPLLLLIGGVVLARSFGVRGAQTAYVIAACACVLWSLGRLKKIEPLVLRRSRPRLNALISIVDFSFPVWVAAFVINPITVYTFSLLARQRNGSYELGMVDVADALKMLVAILPGVVTPVLTPAIIEAVNGDDPPRYSKLLDDSLAAYSALLFPISIGALFLSDVLFTLYGRAYSGSYRLFMPLATCTVLGVLSTPLQVSLVGRGRTWLLLFLSGGKSVSLLAMCLVAVPRLLASGLVWSMYAAEMMFSIAICEVCVALRIAPGSVRRTYYALVTSATVILGSALLLPASWRWALALPISVGSGWLLLRWRPAVGRWITSASPSFARAPLQRGIDWFLGAA